MPQIKVIFFNMGGTLLQLKDTTIPQLYSKHLSTILEQKISPEHVFKAFRKAESWALSRKNFYYLFSDLDQRKYQNAFYNELGIKGRSQINKIELALADLVNLEFQVEKGAKSTLQKLRKEYSIGLISNWDIDLYEILDSFDLRKFFDSITISGEFGISKPSLEIFKSGLADQGETTTKLHTATHLLLSALRIVLKKPDIINENLFPQIRKAAKSIRIASLKNGFDVHLHCI